MGYSEPLNDDVLAELHSAYERLNDAIEAATAKMTLLVR